SQHPRSQAEPGNEGMWPTSAPADMAIFCPGPRAARKRTTMYQLHAPPPPAPRRLDLPPGIDHGLAARMALARVRKLLSAFVAGMVADPARLLATLSGAEFAEPPLQRERVF